MKKGSQLTSSQSRFEMSSASPLDPASLIITGPVIGWFLAGVACGVGLRRLNPG